MTADAEMMKSIASLARLCLRLVPVGDGGRGVGMYDRMCNIYIIFRLFIDWRDVWGGGGRMAWHGGAS